MKITSFLEVIRAQQNQAKEVKMEKPQELKK
jgi:hypothetical protein